MFVFLIFLFFGFAFGWIIADRINIWKHQCRQRQEEEQASQKRIDAYNKAKDLIKDGRIRNDVIMENLTLEDKINLIIKTLTTKSDEVDKSDFYKNIQKEGK